MFRPPFLKAAGAAVLSLGLGLAQAAAAQDSPPRGSDCETPRCAAGTVLNPQTNSCEPVSS